MQQRGPRVLLGVLGPGGDLKETSSVLGLRTINNVPRLKGQGTWLVVGTIREVLGGHGAANHKRVPLAVFPHPTGVVRFYVGICVCDASTPRPHPVARQSSSPVDPAEYPARAARQWIPPSIPPELLASGSHRVSRKSGWPVDPAEYPASGSRPVSHQSSPPVDPAEHPAEYPRVARRWVPPGWLASGSCRASRRVSR